MAKYTGFSLSLCVRDIIDGRVPLNEVDEIITGTMAQTKEDWNRVFDEYKRVWWQTKSAQCVHVARELIKVGKIDQPRLRGNSDHNISDYHWLRDGQPV